MSEAKTILDSIIYVLSLEARPLSVTEISRAISNQDLYQFRSSNPEKMISGCIRDHTEGIIRRGRNPVKICFEQLANGKYKLLEDFDVVDPQFDQLKKEMNELSDRHVHLLETHSDYLVGFKQHVVNQLKTLDPYDFETFAEQLLAEFGFTDTRVTSKSGDGGIDGYGNVQIGLGILKFGFQCKRYNETKITPVHLREFRGSLNEQGLSQGIFFTTSSFSSSALDFAKIPGAIPIMPFDGSRIVELMIEKQFGISIAETLPTYDYALDLNF